MYTFFNYIFEAENIFKGLKTICLFCEFSVDIVPLFSPIELLTLYLWVTYVLENLTLSSITFLPLFVICLWVCLLQFCPEEFWLLRGWTHQYFCYLWRLVIVWKDLSPLVLKEDLSCGFFGLLVHSTLYVMFKYLICLGVILA